MRTFKKYLFKKILFIFREWGRQGGRQGEKQQCVVVTHVAPRPITQACALTGNRTGDPLDHSPHSIYWATWARANNYFLSNVQKYNTELLTIAHHAVYITPQRLILYLKVCTFWPPSPIWPTSPYPTSVNCQSVLPMSLRSFFFKTPHINEIIWYLSFSLSFLGKSG